MSEKKCKHENTEEHDFCEMCNGTKGQCLDCGVGYEQKGEIEDEKVFDED